MLRPFLIGSGMRASAFMTSNSFPPLGTLINAQFVVVGHPQAVVDVHTGTARCGPAPSSGKPRSESPPPVKKDSLKGTRLLAKGCARPIRMLLAQTM